MCWQLLNLRFIIITACSIIMREILVLPAMLLMGVFLMLIIVGLVVVILVIGVCCLWVVAVAIIVLATLRMSGHDGKIKSALQNVSCCKPAVFQKRYRL